VSPKTKKTMDHSLRLPPASEYFHFYKVPDKVNWAVKRRFPNSTMQIVFWKRQNVKTTTENYLGVFDTFILLSENNKRRVEATEMDALGRSSRISRKERIRKCNYKTTSWTRGNNGKRN